MAGTKRKGQHHQKPQQQKHRLALDADEASVSVSKKRTPAPKRHQREEKLISSNLSSKILKEALNQQKEILDEEDNGKPKPFDSISEIPSVDAGSDGDEDIDGFEGFSETQSQFDDGLQEIDEEDERILALFMPNNAVPQLNLADLIIQKIKEKNVEVAAAIYVLFGVVTAIASLILITIWHLFRRKPLPNAVQEDYASKDLALEEATCNQIPLKEIYVATNNINSSNFIGQGIAGRVYKGVLSNGWHVAIKHIIKDGHAETFVREVTSLSHVKHPNLVTLRGYCEEEDECFLVYELCTNGNLSEWLFGKDKCLSWFQRLEIAIGSARGLWFLHTYSGGCIVHRDIKEH